jgi:hypothetical protein
LLNREVTDFKDNILIIGDENYEKELFLNGLSFSEEIIELINAPYVNFVLAAKSEETLQDFNSKYKSSLMPKGTQIIMRIYSLRFRKPLLIFSQ